MGDLLLKRRGRAGLYFGGCAAICTTWALLYAVPMSGRVEEMRGELAVARRAAETAEAEAKELPAELESAAREEMEVKAEISRLPSLEEIPGLARELARGATEVGLHLVDADLGMEAVFDSTASGGVAKIPFTLVVAGRYVEIGRFLEETAGRGRYVELQSVMLDRFGAVRGRIEATVSMNLYASGPETGG